MDQVLTYQWIILTVGLVVLFLISPWAKTTAEFYKATVKQREPSSMVLISSLVISWIFAKSITNAANLGLEFGIVGGLAYSMYYLSFLVAGWIIFKMRLEGKFESIHQFLQSKFGRAAVIVFSVLIGIRLFNEVWSNTMVIGSYFGEAGSGGYYSAILVFTALTLAYALKGGLRSSLLTDVIQMGLFGVLLFIILGNILPQENYEVGKFIKSGNWTMAGGLNLLFAALIQVFSYPFHDPVMTDRAFIASPKKTLRSFIWATGIGMLCITLFSFVGVYAQMRGMEGQAAVMVSESLGVGLMLVMNFIMVTSAASTLDSTFTSFSKLVVIDLGAFGNKSITTGRLAMAGLTILGTIPIFLNAEILSATTVSGTMVIGLAPVFLFWNRDFPPLSFHLSVGTGLVFGVLLAGGWYPESWIFFDGRYGDLLSANLIGTIISFTLYIAGKFIAPLFNIGSKTN